MCCNNRLTSVSEAVITGDFNTVKSTHSSCGIQTAAIVFGGAPALSIAETYNGSTWTEVGDLNTGRRDHAGMGTQTAAISAGGEPSQGITEIWNGTSWTEVNDMNSARKELAMSLKSVW